MSIKDSGYPFERDLMQFEASRDSGSNLIDYKRVIYRAIRYWYVVILTLSVALAIAYSVNRYSTKIYPIKASIIIKENQENVGAKLLYNNPLVNPYRNFYNELYIIRSLPLMSSVVESLGLDIRYYREGEIKTSEIYDPDMPFSFHFLGDQRPLDKSVSFTQIDDKSYSLSLLKESTPITQTELHNFGDTVKLNGYHFVVTNESNGSAQNYFERRIVITFSSVESIASSYINRLTTSWQEQGASVVNLEINGAVPIKEIDFVNELIRQYQQYDLDKKNQTAKQSIEFIDSQLKDIKDSLQYFEQEVETFKQRNVITNLEGEALRLYQRVEGFESSLAQLRLQRNYFQYLTKYLSKEDNLNQVVPPSSVGVEDPIMTNLITELVRLQREVNLQTSSGKEETSLVQRKREQINKIKADIAESVRSSLEAQEINETFIKQQIALVDNQLAKLPASERRLVNLQRNYSLSENLYIYLMQKRAEAGISKASTTSDIVVVNPARQHGGAISPKPIQNYSIAGGLGLILPILFFIILELFNDKVQSKEDIENVSNIPIVGGIGHNIINHNLIVFKKPKSGVSESFRALRSNLNFFTEGKDKKIFLITSSISGEGKTFTTINLATVLAFSGKKTLIVGAKIKPYVADITDKIRIKSIIDNHKPEIIYHAAAYKHVPFMEDNVTEAVKCNIIGTKYLADKALQSGVQKFVMVSTDKAVNPTNVMGCSKRIAEIYVQSLNYHNSTNATKFVTTRFGNVLGSNGSVIPYFKKQIAQGGPVTVTHPDITRYFMTISEACELVIEAGAMGNGGEIFLFDMGKSVKIVDLAKKMIKLSGYEPFQDIEIVYTGLRTGEKLYEELLANKEDTIPTHHEKILIAKVKKYDFEKINLQIKALEYNLENQKSESSVEYRVVSIMKDIVPEFISNSSRFTAIDDERKRL